MAPIRPCSAFVLAVLAPALAGQELPRSSPRVSDYDITAELLPQDKTVRGRQVVTFRNRTSAPTSELRFHLYLNAFRDPRSTFMREAGAEFRSQWREGEFGSLTVSAVRRTAPGEPVELQTGFVQPDDGNPDDATVLRVLLPEPLAPGGEVQVEMDFESRLPKAWRRTGWFPGNGFFAMHWYPILGVLEDDGRGGAVWNCHQFHAFTEFFADYSTYRVALTVPADYVVGATGGEPVDVTELGERTTYTFAQDDVHNFAFVADPDFVRHTDTFGPVLAAEDPTGVSQEVAAALGVPVSSFDLPQTRIILLLHPEHDTAEQRQRHLTATKVGLEFYGLRYGPYPYPAITVVDPGSDALGRSYGGGMEYPTLITCGTSLFPHDRRNRPEGVTVHEFGHQYWYGLSGNNEFEESWLDEGINTYSEGRAQWLAYGDPVRMLHGRPMVPLQVSDFGQLQIAAARGPWVDAAGTLPPRALPLDPLPAVARKTLADLHFEGWWRPDSPVLEVLRAQPAVAWFGEATFEDVWNDRHRFLSTDNPDPMVMDGWLYLDRASYGANSYTRAATVLRTLERMVGRESWWRFLREFHARARFQHPTTEDFVALLGDRCGEEAARFFRAATGAGAVLDYGVYDVRQGPEMAGSRVVRIRNYGNVTASVRVRVTFASGDVEYRTLLPSDQATVHRLVFRDGEGQDRGEITEVWVDPPELAEDQEERAWPAGTYLLDADLLNNAWRRDPDPAPALHRSLRALLQAQCELSFAGLIG